MLRSLVGSEMCIRDRPKETARAGPPPLVSANEATQDEDGDWDLLESLQALASSLQHTEHQDLVPQMARMIALMNSGSCESCENRLAVLEAYLERLEAAGQHWLASEIQEHIDILTGNTLTTAAQFAPSVESTCEQLRLLEERKAEFVHEEDFQAVLTIQAKIDSLRTSKLAELKTAKARLVAEEDFMSVGAIQAQIDELTDAR
eukprot:TRINITY_DN25981_c0_g1_i1.p1 TRINITY_DN25981_c0_g1~~TRINITY_DN25981_c0_g1_i1.p1  ORF type:complete len:204 (+),score=48.17 TRINITY_DN25981_c0_g1_i1:65-676(+)